VNGFICRRYTEHEEKVHRFSYQRTMCEVYNVDENYEKFFVSPDVSGIGLVELEDAGEKTYIERGC
jgi:hypothetical protein